MSSNLAIALPQAQGSQALLRERLAQLEAALLEARGRVMLSFDRELASLRGWMDSLDHLDPVGGLHSVPIAPAPVASPSSALEELVADAPQPAGNNIVPFSMLDFPETGGVIEEPPVDPGLASATLDELNAALAAAFKQVSEK